MTPKESRASQPMVAWWEGRSDFEQIAIIVGSILGLIVLLGLLGLGKSIVGLFVTLVTLVLTIVTLPLQLVFAILGPRK